MGKKKEESRFIDSVTEMVHKVRSFKERTMSNPAIRFPWPPYVPKPEILDRHIAGGTRGDGTLLTYCWSSASHFYPAFFLLTFQMVALFYNFREFGRRLLKMF